MGRETPTRLPKGVVNRESWERFNMFGMLDPTKWITYWDDFAGATDSLPNATDANYTVTKTGAGTIAQADGLGGWSILTNAAADNDAVFVQKKGEAFLWQATKRLFFAIRFKLSDATDSDFVAGLQITDTTPLDVTDGIFFLKADDAATVTFNVEKDNAASQLAAFTTLANDTFVELAFEYEGAATVVNGSAVYRFNVYVNGALAGVVDASTNVPDDELLCVSFGVQNGAAAAKTATIDYIFAALER